ncbi:hypothetical protein [Nocardia tengchongensis]|uniref:hypothetical protein n=1 Tax=Nocardia tengchongensis TaxID=2055889 RepID=UPI00368506C6
MSGRHTRECRWCGDWFNVESPHSPALYCKRTHKTAAEKARKQLREAGIQPCPQPWSSAEPYRGPAIAAARRLGTCADQCVCGNFHIHPREQRRGSMKIDQLMDPTLLELIEGAWPSMRKPPKMRWTTGTARLEYDWQPVT